MDLTIVIPAYNEARRLPGTLAHMTSWLATKPWASEIIVVDDGSTDDTVQAVTAAKRPVRLLSHQQNLGKGAAVRRGMLAGTGTWRLLCDADLSTPIEELDRLNEYRAAADIIIGSRRVSGATIGRRQAWWKVRFGQLGNLLVQILLLPGLKDTQCGFKLFHQRTMPIFRQQRVNRWGYDFELLYLARLSGWRIREVPVRWDNDADSKVTISAYLTTLGEIGRILWYRWRGYYRR
ncbi:MAG: glycosyltransferase family 2 protein [Candidatus Kerfeldbacteria bacterium]|nr:glycosyltransferase family 2 protein [Candidatus Kerfeldbacteria bacterium]